MIQLLTLDLEQMPVADNVADVVVSDCVLNLVPNKRNVIAEQICIEKRIATLALRIVPGHYVVCQSQQTAGNADNYSISDLMV